MTADDDKRDDGAEGESFEAVLRDVARAEPRTMPGKDDLVGEMLGPYRVIAMLGQGGMGVVYRGEDTRLMREVALKVLPAGVSTHAERRRRLLREARSAASINHPNIATVYDVGDAGGRIYLAMELVEGVTLRAHMAGGPIEAVEATRIAREIAAGLARAHEKGVVHRDLKPENVMLARDGSVKILDFGLAKLREPISSDSALVRQDTQTQEGIVMGTPGYMSPEQATGNAADQRTDVYALGVTLHEMLTGELPGAHGSGRVAEDARLAAIVARCLARAPEDRFHDAGEVVEALQKGAAPGPERASRRGVGLAAAAVAAAVAAVALAGGLVVRNRGVTSSLSAASSSSAAASASGVPPAPPAFKDRRLTAFPAENLIGDAALSPDGMELVFSDHDGFWVQPADGGGRHALAVPRGEETDAVSFFPDGKRVLVTTAQAHRTTAYSAPVDGSASVLVFREVDDNPMVSPDGRLIGHSLGTTIEVGPAEGGPRIRIATCKACHIVRWSPDGKRILFVDEPARLVEASVDTRETHTLYTEPHFKDGYTFAWPTTNRILFGCRADEDGYVVLNELSVDDAGIATSKPREIWRSRGSSIGSLTASHDRMAVIVSDWLSDVYLAGLGPRGRGLRGPPQRLPMSNGSHRHPAWLSDGRLVYLSGGRGGDTVSAQALGSTDVTVLHSETNGYDAILQNGDIVYLRRVQQSDAGGKEMRTMVASPDGTEREIEAERRDDSAGQGYNRRIRCGGRDPHHCVRVIRADETTTLAPFDLVAGRPGNPFCRLPTPHHSEVAVSPDGKIAAVVADSDVLTLCEVDTGKSISTTTTPHATNLRGIDFTPDGQSLIITGLGFDSSPYGTIRVGLDGRGEMLYASPNVYAEEPSVSPDGKTLALHQLVLHNDVWLIEPK